MIMFTLGVMGVPAAAQRPDHLMSLELMFNAGNLAFVAFSRYYMNYQRPDRGIL